MQALSDLRAVSAELQKPRNVIALGPEGEAHYEMLSRGEGSASAPERTELREALRRAATAPSPDPSGALVATAVPLADALEREAAEVD